MIYKILLISDEVDDFAREISIDSDATFLDLQNAILKSVNYSNDQMTSFFICDENWEKETEVTLVDMENNYEEDSWIMESTRLSDLIEEEKQHLLFVFDFMTERSFFMELHEVVLGESLSEAQCTKSKGEAPKQLLTFDESELKIDATSAAAVAAPFDMDDDFDSDFGGLDLDEGFDDLDIREGNPFE